MTVCALILLEITGRSQLPRNSGPDKKYNRKKFAYDLKINGAFLPVANNGGEILVKRQGKPTNRV